MNPLDTIEPNPPNVWLKGLYFFEPRDEGFLGFTEEWARRKFLERTKPGVLVVIYGTGPEHLVMIEEKFSEYCNCHTRQATHTSLCLIREDEKRKKIRKS